MSELEIGVVGAGWWACDAHIPTLLDNEHVATVSVCRPDEAGLGTVLSQFGLEHGFTSAEEMLAARPLDGVVVASPHVLHAEHALMAIDKGLPLLVEKPFGTSAAEAHGIERAAAAKGVPVMMPYGWNYKPMTDKAHELMRAGRVGEVRHVAAQMASALRDLFAGEDLSDAKEALFMPASSTWADPDRSGGYGWGQLTHGLGALFRLIDDDPAEVYARFGMSPARVDYYDAAVVTFAGGATMALSGAGTVPKSRGFQVDIRIFGTEGMLLYDIERARLELIRDDGADHLEPLAPDAGDYVTDAPANRFVELCRGAGPVNPADATLGRRATQLLDAMYRSAKSGKPEECQ